MASAQRLFNRRGSSDSTSSEDGVKGNVNFNINAPEFIPKWKLPTSVNPDNDMTGFSPKEVKNLETEKEPDLEKSIKKKVKLRILQEKRTTNIHIYKPSNARFKYRRNTLSNVKEDPVSPLHRHARNKCSRFRRVS